MNFNMYILNLGTQKDHDEKWISSRVLELKLNLYSTNFDSGTRSNLGSSTRLRILLRKKT